MALTSFTMMRVSIYKYMDLREPFTELSHGCCVNGGFHSC